MGFSLSSAQPAGAAALLEEHPAQFELVVAADVVYTAEAVAPLVATVSLLLAPTRSAQFVLAFTRDTRRERPFVCGRKQHTATPLGESTLSSQRTPLAPSPQKKTRDRAVLSSLFLSLSLSRSLSHTHTHTHTHTYTAPGEGPTDL